MVKEGNSKKLNFPAFTDVGLAKDRRERLKTLREREAAESPTTDREKSEQEKLIKILISAKKYGEIGDEVAIILGLSSREELLRKDDRYFQRREVGEAINQVFQKHFPPKIQNKE